MNDQVPDTLVPQPRVQAEFGVSCMTIWRWQRNEKLDFPAAIRLNNRNYFSRRALEEWKKRLIDAALKARRCLGARTKKKYSLLQFSDNIARWRGCGRASSPLTTSLIVEDYMDAKIIPPKACLKQSLLAATVRRVWSRHRQGYGFLAARREGRWVEEGFPIDGDGIEDFFARYWYRRYDLYFCPNAFNRKRRLGMFALPTCYSHVDIDAADPAAFDPPPTLLVETSPKRYQGIWEFTNTVEPRIAESVSRALTRTYGGDAGGWSATKMLRVPGSMNHKDAYDLPVVSVVRDTGTPIAAWPDAANAIRPEGTGGPREPCPPVIKEPADYDEALKRFRAALKSEPLASRRMWLIVHVVKTKDQVFKQGVDRSHVLRQIILRLRAVGLTEGETFALAWRSGWNKFRVDGRSEDHLWHEIDKAYGKLKD